MSKHARFPQYYANLNNPIVSILNPKAIFYNTPIIFVLPLPQILNKLTNGVDSDK